MPRNEKFNLDIKSTYDNKQAISQANKFAKSLERLAKAANDAYSAIDGQLKKSVNDLLKTTQQAASKGDLFTKAIKDQAVESKKLATQTQTLQKQLKDTNKHTAQLTKNFDKMAKDTVQFAKGQAQANKELLGAADKTRELKVQSTNLNKISKDLNRQIKQNTQVIKDQNKEVKESAGFFKNWQVSTLAVIEVARVLKSGLSGSINAVKGFFSAIKDADENLAEMAFATRSMQDTLKLSQPVMNEFEKQLQGLAKKSSQSNKEIYRMANLITAVGGSPRQAIDGVQAALSVMRDKGVEANTVLEAITDSIRSGSTENLSRLGINVQQYTQLELLQGKAIQHINQMYDNTLVSVGRAGEIIGEIQGQWSRFVEFLVNEVSNSDFFIKILRDFEKTVTDLEDMVPDLLEAFQEAFEDWKDPVLGFTGDLNQWLLELPGLISDAIKDVKPFLNFTLTALGKMVDVTRIWGEQAVFAGRTLKSISYDIPKALPSSTGEAFGAVTKPFRDVGFTPYRPFDAGSPTGFVPYFGQSTGIPYNIGPGAYDHRSLYDLAVEGSSRVESQDYDKALRIIAREQLDNPNLLPYHGPLSPDVVRNILAAEQQGTAYNAVTDFYKRTGNYQERVVEARVGANIARGKDKIFELDRLSRDVHGKYQDLYSGGARSHAYLTDAFQSREERYGHFTLDELQAQFDAEKASIQTLRQEYEDYVFDEYGEFLHTYRDLIPEAKKKALGLGKIDTKEFGRTRKEIVDIENLRKQYKAAADDFFKEIGDDPVVNEMLDSMKKGRKNQEEIAKEFSKQSAAKQKEFETKMENLKKIGVDAAFQAGNILIDGFLSIAKFKEEASKQEQELEKSQEEALEAFEKAAKRQRDDLDKSYKRSKAKLEMSKVATQARVDQLGISQDLLSDAFLGGAPKVLKGGSEEFQDFITEIKRRGGFSQLPVAAQKAFDDMVDKLEQIDTSLDDGIDKVNTTFNDNETKLRNKFEDDIGKLGKRLIDAENARDEKLADIAIKEQRGLEKINRSIQDAKDAEAEFAIERDNKLAEMNEHISVTLPNEYQKAYTKMYNNYNTSFDKITTKVADLKDDLEDLVDSSKEIERLAKEDAKYRTEQIIKGTQSAIEEQQKRLREANLSLLEPFKKDGDFFSKFFGFAEALRDRNKIAKSVEEEIRDLEKKAVRELEAIDRKLETDLKKLVDQKDGLVAKIEEGERQRKELNEKFLGDFTGLFEKHQKKITDAEGKRDEYEGKSQKKLDDLAQKVTDLEADKSRFIEDIARERSKVITAFEKAAGDIRDQAKTLLDNFNEANVANEAKRNETLEALNKAHADNREEFFEDVEMAVGKITEEVAKEKTKLEDIDTSLGQLAEDYQTTVTRMEEDEKSFRTEQAKQMTEFKDGVTGKIADMNTAINEGIAKVLVKGVVIAGLTAAGVPAPIAAQIAEIVSKLAEYFGVIQTIGENIQEIRDAVVLFKDWFELQKKQGEQRQITPDKDSWFNRMKEWFRQQGGSDGLVPEGTKKFDDISTNFTHNVIDPLGETLVAFNGNLATLGINLKQTSRQTNQETLKTHKRALGYIDQANSGFKEGVNQSTHTFGTGVVDTTNVMGSGLIDTTNVMSGGLVDSTNQLVTGVNSGANLIVDSSQISGNYLEKSGVSAGDTLMKDTIHAGKSLMSAGAINAKQQIDSGFQFGQMAGDQNVKIVEEYREWLTKQMQQQRRSSGNWLSKLGGIVGGMFFGPAGAAIGAGAGSLLGGGSVGDALMSGFGSYVGAGGNFGNPLGQLGSGIQSKGLQMAFGGTKNYSAQFALGGVGGGPGSWGFPGIGTNWGRDLADAFSQYPTQRGIPIGDSYNSQFGWSNKLRLDPNQVGIDYAGSIPTDLVFEIDKKELGKDWRAAFRKRAKEYFGGESWEESRLEEFFGSGGDRGAFDHVYDLLDEKLQGVSDALNPILKNAQTVLGLGLYAKETIDHYNFIQDTWNEIFHRKGPSQEGIPDLLGEDGVPEKAKKEVAKKIKEIEKILKSPKLLAPKLKSPKVAQYYSRADKPIYLDSSNPSIPPVARTEPELLFGDPYDSPPVSGDKFVDHLSDLIDKKLNARGVLSTAEAFNAFREREKKEDKLPIKLQIQIGDQKLADILREVQESGYIERVVV